MTAKDFDEEKVRELLQKLGQEIITGLVASRERINIVSLQRTRISDFSFSWEQGINGYSFKHEEYQRPSFSDANNAIGTSIRESETYTAILGVLSSEKNALLYQFVSDAIEAYLSENETTFSDLIGNFINDVKEGPFKVLALAAVSGRLQPDEIKINQSVKIRHPRKDDFEPDMSDFHGKPAFSPFKTGSIIEINVISNDRSKTSSEINRLIRESVAVLRLFKLGNLYLESYQEFPMGTRRYHWSQIWVDHNNSAPEAYLLSDSDTGPIIKFWNGIQPFLSSNLLKIHEKPQSTSIAYERYTDSLVTGGSIERRIAYAIMGLEGLFLRNQERAELNYRLKQRIAKLLQNYSYDVRDVKKSITIAYEIRSQFLHGSHLSKDEFAETEKKYGDSVENLLFKIQDYLRISIIFTLTSKKNKEQYLSLIEDAFFFPEKQDELKRLVDISKKMLIIP